MNNHHFCQSCTMPIDNPEIKGTEKDGSKNNDYCRYCYKDGALLNPDMTLKEMTKLVITQMEKMQMDARTIDIAVSNLPYLKRWKPVLVVK